jgi:hypothetical protein
LGHEDEAVVFALVLLFDFEVAVADEGDEGGGEEEEPVEEEGEGVDG